VGGQIELERFLIIFGITLVALGLLWPLLQKLGLGNLPGDIVIEQKNFTLYFPLTSCLLLSVLITVILHLFHK
jgi:hypothetical protein